MLAQVPIFSIFFSLCTPTLGIAQSSNTMQPIKDTSIVKEAQLEAIQIVATGSYVGRLPEKSVLPVQCISERQIRQMGVRDAGELLSRSLNIQVQQDNILGAGLSFQGLSGQNVKILVDDVPMIGRLNGNIDLSQINLRNIERVEIIEGPASVLFGTDALAGVINFITKKNLNTNPYKTAQTPSKAVNFQTNYHYESVGHHNIDASASWSSNNGRFWQSVMLDGGRNAFLGWSPNDTTRWKQWKPRIQYFLNGKYHFGTDKMRFGYAGAFFDEFMLNRGIPLRPYNINAFDDHYLTRRYTNSFSANFTLSKDYTAKFIISHNAFQRTKNTYFRDLTTLSNTLTDNEGDQDTTKFSLITARGAFIRSAKEKVNFEVGYDVNIETGASMRLLHKTHQIGDYAAFSSAEWIIFSRDTEGGDKSSLVIRPGLRWSYNTAYQAPITPSLNLKWDISSAWVARACYARGFRAPNLKELYFYFVDINHNIRGNESLLAERSHSANVSFFGKKAFNNKIAGRVEAVGFFNDVANLITLAQIRAVENGGTPEFGYVNIGRVQTLGTRLSGSLVWGDMTVMPGINWLQRRSQFTGDGAVFTANNMEYRFNVMYEIKPYHLTINFLVKHTGQQQGFAADEAGNVSINQINAYTMSDITFNKSIWKNKIRLNVGVKNLMNVTNVQAQMAGGTHTEGGGSTAIATGRTLFSTFTFQF